LLKGLLEGWLRAVSGVLGESWGGEGDVCERCGTSRVGRVEARRLGADEAGELVRCKCPSPGEMGRMARESVEESRAVVGFVGEPDEWSLQADRAVGEVELAGSVRDLRESRLEVEIRLSPGLSRQVGKVLSGYQRTSWTEYGFPAEVPHGEHRLSGKLRVRSTGETSLKATLSRSELAPGMTYCESVEATVTVDWLRSITAANQVYNVLATETGFSLGVWACRHLVYQPGGQHSCEFEYLATGRPSSGEVAWLLYVVHMDTAHVPALRTLLDREFVESVRSAALPVADLRSPPEGDYSYRAKADGEHNWLFDMGSLWYLVRNDPALTVVG
jgi:hypothetical protein